MIRLYIIAEGTTEETFIDEILRPALLDKQVHTTIRLMNGDVRYSRLKRDVVTSLKSDRGIYCTTFLDYYGLGRGFPARDSIGKFTRAAEKKRALEEAVRADITEALGESCDHSRFIPYIQMHEFEGLLFSDPPRLVSGIGKPELLPQLQAIRSLFDTPEDINDDKKTAPSKRLKELYPGYTKEFLGNLAAIEIGLGAIRASCPLFNEWVTRLEQLGASGA